MKKIIIIIFILLFSLSLYAKSMHGSYISTWNPGLLSKKEVKDTIIAAKNIGITDLFIQVRRMDDAYYNSKIVPKPTNLKENFDMLDYAVKLGHENNIKIHAWFVICRIGKGDYKKTLNNTKISWLNKDNKGNYLNENNVFIDPSNYEAKKYIISVIKEVEKNYNIDGIHLDYIRYPNKSYGYTENSLLQYTLQTGETFPTTLRFDNFRREQITNFIYEIRKSLNKNTVLSASIVSWGEATNYKNLSSYNNTFQDYEKWINNNLVDFIVPMIYKREHIEKQSKDYTKWLNLYKPNKNKIIPAIGAYLNDAKGIKKQIINTEKAGYNNWIIYEFNQGKGRNNVINALK